MIYFIRASRVLSGGYYILAVLLFLWGLASSEELWLVALGFATYTIFWALSWSAIHYIVLGDFYPWARKNVR